MMSTGAHPRSRGENVIRSAIRSPPTGSSPLTRGKLRWCGAAGVGVRLIPAHAGKTSRCSRPATDAAAHPRSRGENERRESVKPIRFGSSPLTRGKHCSTGWGWGPRRLIPAHAGKTHGYSPVASVRAAHPRSRGENSIGASLRPKSRGSSPLTRGKLRGDSLSSAISGLIPAHAGKTQQRRRREPCGRAHPRSRGENLVRKAGNAVDEGSSPLTRGKRSSACTARHRPRLIPAHAGKTRSWMSRHLSFQALPRSRGENLRVVEIDSQPWGSSPLTRGKQPERRQTMPISRLIPAHAGKTHPQM